MIEAFRGDRGGQLYAYKPNLAGRELNHGDVASNILFDRFMYMKNPDVTASADFIGSMTVLKPAS